MDGAARGRRVIRLAARGLDATAVTLLVLGAAAPFFVPLTHPGPIVGGLVLLYAALVLRLLVAALEERALARLILTAGLVMWALGGLTLIGLRPITGLGLPLPGAEFFLLSYVLITVYLLTDVPRGRRPTVSASVAADAVIVVGGATCLAGTAMLLAAQHSSAWSPELMIALLYPVLDIVLAGIVVLQTRAGVRSSGRVSAAFVVAFALLALSSADLAAQFVDGADTGGRWAPLMAPALVVLVRAACSRQGPARSRPLPGRGTPVAALLGGAFVCLLAVTFLPGDADASFLLAPIMVTLAAGQARMWLALREARGAGEARALSLTDDLTGLPNRRALLGHLGGRLRDTQPLALILLDLDGFKEINDGLGHHAGDRLLTLVGERLRVVDPDTDLIARLGGDEFAVAVTTNDPARLRTLGLRMLDALRATYTVDGIQLSVEGSMGVTVREPDDRQAEDLLRRADVAMYQAKETGQNPLLYDPRRDEFSRRRLEMINGLREGIEAGQLEVWYQPQVDARTRRPCGLEALVRWRHPEIGLIPPGEFLPAARRGGLMARLSQEVARTVIADAARWSLPGGPPRVSMNVAPPELLGTVFVPGLLQDLRGAGLDPSSLVLEVTEDSFVSDPGRARYVLEALADEGIGVSIDDYGTGFSSLAYLRDLPVEELKIDRSFIAAVDSDERSRKIVLSTASLAQALSMRVVAEGVEDGELADSLLGLGIDVLQGYYLSRPLPFDDVVAWWEEAVRDAAVRSSTADRSLIS